MNTAQQQSTADKRAQVMGRRIAGYCGHIPEFRPLAPPSADAGKPALQTLPDLPHVSPAALAAARASRLSASTSPAPAAAGADMGPRETSPARAPPPVVPPRIVNSRPTSASRGHTPAPRAVAGYGGHRAGDQFATGASVNGPRKSDVLSTQMHAEQSTEWKRKLSGSPPIPKYPNFRGPTRTTPLGMDCFLTI